MGAPKIDNNDEARRLNLAHEPLTRFSESTCGCITRGDGEKLRYCGTHNPKIGTKSL